MTLYDRYLAAQGLVSTDSRQPQPGTLFFALNGPTFRGAAFAPQALEKGASHAVVDDEVLARTDPARYTFRPDPLVALQQLALEHRRRFRGPVLALTGSNGKTTTKELLAAVLRQKFAVLATQGNLNNHIGVPLTLLRLRPAEHDFAVVEMGANHQGEIHGYCQYAEPTHGLITNIGKAHLEGFGGQEGIARGKSELFRFVAARGGTLFVNTLDPRLPGLAAAAAAAAPQATLVSYPGPADTYPAELLPPAADAGPEAGLRVAFGRSTGTGDGRSTVGAAKATSHLALTGEYNFPNVAAAAAVGSHFGVPAPAIAAALAAYVPDNNRSELRRTARGNHLLLDAYNANPSSMAAALRAFASRPGPAPAEKAVVLADMFELGEESAAEHRALGELVHALGFGTALLVGPDMAHAAAVAPRARHFATKAEAADWLRAHPLAHRHVLVKGSRGMALETLVEVL